MVPTHIYFTSIGAFEPFFWRETNSRDTKSGQKHGKHKTTSSFIENKVDSTLNLNPLRIPMYSTYQNVCFGQ